MIPELGHLCLVLALCLAGAQAFFGLAGPLTNRPAWTAVARPAAVGQFVFVATAFGLLTHAFIVNDFSVSVSSVSAASSWNRCHLKGRSPHANNFTPSTC